MEGGSSSQRGVFLTTQVTFILILKHQIITKTCKNASRAEIVAPRYRPPHNISIIHWLQSFLDISEPSSAKVNVAQSNTTLIWTNWIYNLKDLSK